MKILVTGAHFTPAQAVIKKLLDIPEIEIVYLGRRYARDDDTATSIESKILPNMGVKFIPLTAGKLNRFLSIQTIISLAKTPIGFIQSFYYLLKEQPDLIVSFGGFTGMPVVINGWLLSIPSLIHEQSLKMGLANFISSFFANKIALSFKDSRTSSLLNKDKFTVTGNPIREELLSPENSASKEIKEFVSSAKRAGKDIVLVTAGNQGSHRINLLIEDTLTEITKDTAIIHQTGDSKFDDFANLSKHQSKNYLVKKWIEAVDLNFILDNADLVVSRAGMNTLMEISLKSVPTLIVPIPVGSEQKENARYFSKAGLGEVVPEKELTPEVFKEKIQEMLGRKIGLKKLAEKARDLVVLDADKRLLQEILLILNSSKNLNLTFK